LRKVALAAGALAMAAVAQLLLLRGHHLDWAVVLYSLAVVALAAAAWGERERARPVQVWSPRAISRAARIRGWIALVAALAAAGGAAWLYSRDWRFLYRALLLYGVGIVLAMCGFSQLEGWSLPGAFIEGWRALRRRKWEAICLGLILAVALFLRLYRLEYYPPPGGISWNDEAQIGKDAHEFLRGRAHPWQFPLSVYGTALSFSLLGESVLSLRLTFILFGFAMLVPFFFLARLLFDPWVALAGTFLLGVSRWHISFTKLALPSTPVALLELLVFLFVLRGWRTKGKANYLWAGAALGVGMYSHASFRIVPLLLLLLLLHRVLSVLWDTISSLWRGRVGRGQVEGTSSGPLAAGIKSNVFGITTFLVTTFLFAYPYLALVRREPTLAFMERFTSVMPVVFAPEKADYVDQLARRTRDALLYFNYRGEGWGAINLPGAPMLDPVTGVLFALGLGYAALHFWRKRCFFLISCFLLIMIAGGVLTREFRTHRIFIVIPFVYLLICLCLDRIWQAFRRQISHREERMLVIPLGVVLVASGWYNYDAFFNRQIHAQEVRQEFLRDVAAVANYIASLETGTYVYLFADFPFYRPGHDFAWMASDPPGRQATDIEEVLPSRDSTSSDVAYIFVDPYDGDTLSALVKQVYPEAIIEVHEGDYHRYRFVICLVPREAVKARKKWVR